VLEAKQSSNQFLGGTGTKGNSTKKGIFFPVRWVDIGTDPQGEDLAKIRSSDDRRGGKETRNRL